MNRRNVLKLTGAGLVATVLPVWLARGFASREVGELPELDDDLGNAIDRGRRLGKPVIVFVVPKDPRARWDRGEILGDALHGGGDALFADLALAELVCAGADDVAKRFPEVDDGTEPLAYLIEKDTGRARIRRLDVELAPRPRAQWIETEESVRTELATWIAPFVVALRSAVFRDDEELAYRERIARRSLDELSIEAADAAIRAGNPSSLAQVDKCAALFRFEADTSNGARATWIPLLAQAGRERLVVRAPMGASWTALGADSIDPRASGYACQGCGMARLPQRSEHMLHLFTRDE